MIKIVVLQKKTMNIQAINLVYETARKLIIRKNITCLVGLCGCIWIINKVAQYLYLYNSTLTHGHTILRKFCKLNYTDQKSIASAERLGENSPAWVYGKCEIDSHVDTIVADTNYVILQYMGKEWDVSHSREYLDLIKNVPIVHTSTAWKSPEMGHLGSYWGIMDGYSMDHSLVNLNQLRHYGTKVQYNSISAESLPIITEYYKIFMNLAMEGTIVYDKTHYPTENYLQTWPNIMLSSPNNWNTNLV